MTEMTKNANRNHGALPISSENELEIDRTRILTVLCVHENPVFLDRLCRHLERRGDLSVDTTTSVEDALHLMKYVLFDVIVTDYNPVPVEKNSFLKTVRNQGNAVPFIYFTQRLNAEIETEIRVYSAVYVVEWEEETLSRGFDDLYLSVKQAAAKNRKGNASLQKVLF